MPFLSRGRTAHRAVLGYITIGVRHGCDKTAVIKYLKDQSRHFHACGTYLAGALFRKLAKRPSQTWARRYMLFARLATFSGCDPDKEFEHRSQTFTLAGLLFAAGSLTSRNVDANYSVAQFGKLVECTTAKLRAGMFDVKLSEVFFCKDGLVRRSILLECPECESLWPFLQRLDTKNNPLMKPGLHMDRIPLS